MALDWENPNYFLNQNNYHQFDPFQFHDDSPLLDTELLCFDPLPPSLFDFDEPLFDPPPLQPLHEVLLPTTNVFTPVDFPPPMLAPTDDFFAFDHDFSSHFPPLPKKQKQEPLPCYNDFIFPHYPIAPEIINHNYHHYNGYDYGSNYFCGANFVEGCGMNYSNDDDKKAKVVTAQSKAARERRRKITDKTQELGKLIPGAHKMNTAEMLQAASNYVKFMQAQLAILQSIDSLQHEEIGNKEAKLNNLPIVTSTLVQEKLYAKEKCLVPLDFLSILEEHCDPETKPSISQHISNLLH